MIRFVALTLLVVAPALHAQQEEDAAHHADRLRTEQLNRQAAQAVARRGARNDDGEASYQAARADYERRLAAWRKRVADCENGYWSACQ